jgi:hypothetical protein
MRSTILCAVALAATAAHAGHECDQTAARQAHLPAGGVASVSVEAKAGSLKIVGIPGLGTIRAHGTACASSRDLLEEVRLNATRRGNIARIEVDIPEWKGWKQAARLDLIVEVPARIDVELSDGSGDILVDGVGNLTVDDGSGSLRIENIQGSVNIEDGSGDILLRNIAGDVEIDDGSGGIEATQISGSVEIDDSSGGIRLREVRNNVTIDDSSGGIDVAGVGGDFTVRSDGSGGVNYADVRGQVRIPRKD